MKYPLVSIIIATINSEKSLPTTLESIKKQSYPKNKIEVLVIDGRSRDNTRKIARQYGYKVIDNPNLGFIPAKYLGFMKASGKYAMYLDSDEELESEDSIKNKISVFGSEAKVRGVISTGYKSPKNYPLINRYINEFGDPFTYFIYGEGKNAKFFLKALLKEYKKVKETKDFVIFDFSKAKPIPLIELVAMGCMLDLESIRKEFPSVKTTPNLIPHLFYLLNKENFFIAVTKNDAVIHYSADTLVRYLNKIAWRVRNNIYNKSSAGSAGFEGRELFQPFLYRFKRYLFIPYSFSIIFPIIDSLYLTCSRRDFVFLLHPLLCIYTSLLIMYYFSLNLLKVKPDLKIYGT